MCSCLLDQSQLHFLPVEVLYSKWLVIASYPRNLLNASQVSKELFLAERLHYLSMGVIGFILRGGECIGVPRYLEREVGYILHGQVR